MIAIANFNADGWRPAEAAEVRAKACCEQLERGEILLLGDSSLMISSADQEILTQVPPDALAHKNIAYEPITGALRGLRRGVE
ncbi:MAG TPA: Kdo hydroxylase family protein, partial [Candidatus Binataceae bacterium]|nr:Kdo hydroxylase family protein [Candidatus Binataceae bacterium]